MWADDAEARQDQDVHFGMTEEPEQVLEQHGVAALLGHEEAGAEVAVGEQHGDRAGQHRSDQQQQERRHQHRPHEQRHLVQRHAGRAHVEDGGDEVDRAQDRRRAGDVQRQDRVVHRRTALGRQRRVDRPAAAHAGTVLALDEHRDDEQQQRRREQPERDVVHAREGHVGRADHQRHEPLPEPADHRRHHHEEDHDQAVGGHEHVVHVLAAVDGRLTGREAVDHGGKAREVLDAGLLQFETHDDRQDAADDPRDDREDQVHRADVLVVGGVEVAAPARRMVVVVGVGCVY